MLAIGATVNVGIKCLALLLDGGRSGERSLSLSRVLPSVLASYKARTAACKKVCGMTKSFAALPPKLLCQGFRVLDAARRRDPAVDTCLLPETNDVMLVSDPEPMRFPWRFLFDLLSLEHRSPAEIDGHCFKTLVVGASLLPIDVARTCCSCLLSHCFQTLAISALLPRSRC